MIKPKKYLLIVNAQVGQPPTGGGVQAKNQQLIAYLNTRKDISWAFVDTWGKSHIKSLLQTIIAIIKSDKGTTLVFSITRDSVVAILRILGILGIKRKSVLLLPGGDEVQSLDNISRKYLSHPYMEKIYVQGGALEGVTSYLKKSYEKAGLNNVEVLPNFKTVDYLPMMKDKPNGALRMVFLGRLLEAKGIGIIIKAMHVLKDANCTIDLYGTESDYTRKSINEIGDERICYKGFLDLSSSQGYDTLAEYDVLVFPTYFEGEGFPGVLIDAFVAGLPIIATDFHAIPEIVRDNYNGLLCKTCDEKSLADTISVLIEDKALLMDMSKKSRDSLEKYLTKNVLSAVFPRSI